MTLRIVVTPGLTRGPALSRIEAAGPWRYGRGDGKAGC